MKYLILMDSYKGSLTSLEAGNAVKEGLLNAGIPESEIAVFPVADGGEGTADAISYARSMHASKHEYMEKSIPITTQNSTLTSIRDGTISQPTCSTRKVLVTGPLEATVEAEYSIIELANCSESNIASVPGASISSGISRTARPPHISKLAIIDMAAAAGLPLVPEDQRNPLYTTTYGVGEMILDAIDNGCRDFIIGIGGSATNDGGVGMLQALGFEFTDSHGEPVKRGAIGLKDLTNIDFENTNLKLMGCKFRIACDVNNPLTGPNGCSAVFAPQKGATPEAINDMDKWLSQYANLVEHISTCDASYIHHQYNSIVNKTGLIPNRNYPGAGAAGGLGYAFLMFLNSTLEPGISIVLDEMRIQNKLIDTEYIITGEGRIDEQSAMGKVLTGISNMISNKQADSDSSTQATASVSSTQATASVSGTQATASVSSTQATASVSSTQATASVSGIQATDSISASDFTSGFDASQHRTKIVIFAGSEGPNAANCLKLPHVEDYIIISPKDVPKEIAMKKDIAASNLSTAVTNYFISN